MSRVTIIDPIRRDPDALSIQGHELETGEPDIYISPNRGIPMSASTLPTATAMEATMTQVTNFAPTPRFPLGQTVMTASFRDTLGELAAAVIAKWILGRHQSGDWGDVCPSDAGANEAALADDERILSVYHVGPADNREKVYVITEHDRSVTTVMLASDY
jgi:hypothetical protein